ncbi:MAG: helix-turn-helix domain-containing protein [Actinomycetota bacterium]|nr:helix-turn-helix domain-containing protein [Actinomycetota bacterium]
MSADWARDSQLSARAALHAALGEPARLAIVEDLATSDRSPRELADRLSMPSNLLAHHLEVLEEVGLIARSASAGDGRRKYVRLVRPLKAGLETVRHSPRGEMLFLCSQNSARSQLAAALWTARTGGPASSAGTRPASRVHRGAVAAAGRAGVSLAEATPRSLGSIPSTSQVVTVCDVAHEELEPASNWWHWSIPDPVPTGTAAAFDAVVAELDARIASAAAGLSDSSENKSGRGRRKR